MGKEIIWVIILCLSFVGGLLGIGIDNRIVILGAFLIHGITVMLLLFFRTTNSEKEEEAENDEGLEEEILSDLSTEQNRKVESLSHSLTEALAREEALKEDLKSEQYKNGVLIEELNLKKKELVINEEKKAEPGDDNVDNLLPPLKEGQNNFEPINIVKVAQETVKELEGFAKKAGIQILISSQDEILVKADGERIRIMFRNIIDNSVKYMGKAGSVVITISNVGTDIFIVLKDNGTGLSADETERIFELNYQGSNRISGNGLGLTQAKAIVTAYGGTIYAKSNTGKGMGIYIQLPTD